VELIERKVVLPFLDVSDPEVSSQPVEETVEPPRLAP
jgi:hypothetical protein